IMVKNNEIIGEGWHQKYGEAHAEVNAIASCKKNGHSPEGATAYVTLEPCAHQGKTGPCADKLIAEKISRCVIAIGDPYPEVNGKGIEKLRRAGIEVEVGVLEQEAREQNKFFLKYSTTGLPYITVKQAMSLDGKISLKTSATKYISSEASRRIVHQMRTEYDAVLVASATVIADDPELTVRLVEGRSPKRIILDASLRVDEQAKVYSDQYAASTIVVVNEKILTEKRTKASLLSDRGITFIPIASKTEQLDLSTVFAELGKRHITSILVEPGPTLATTILQSSLADEVVLFLAPMVLGDDAKSAFGDLHLRSLTEAGRFRLAEVRQVPDSEDVYINLRPN
ncbi:MAG TPA: bifunctional diaminohydroxyphosphoribosylaminopyrimidine deaminase/5-amino-6-(5-phosphoribosylamino)uracil reductase RibD, partial [Candidatus Kapabacteria bacterium]|nr:bifunctional diaminohydroxyphosphoribosylaminopyrimidine deaminase/5-amino-6-(5-phosphoribosylamino)uracil reductase RibD [Candidatus Kapabacteria bacterium]